VSATVPTSSLLLFLEESCILIDEFGERRVQKTRMHVTKALALPT
jgi:hypothetical protein